MNTMGLWTTLALVCFTSSLTGAEIQIPARIQNICDNNYNATSKIQCLCDKDSTHLTIQSADCYITNENLVPDDPYWDHLAILMNTTKLSLTNARGKSLKYIPTRGLQSTISLTKLDIKYNNIPKIDSYAFANLTKLKEIFVKDNKIEVLETNAFAHLKKLNTIMLDKNNIAEINRNVFVDLPNLRKLYLTTNVITTIHDRAFVHLSNLRLLEIDNNGLFSLNNETFSGLINLEILDLSGNSLEVIGDNTFLPLKNLRSLNLEGNKLQMLDDKAFNGLGQLKSLTLAANKIVSIDSAKIFEVLKDLRMLSLRENQLSELKQEVMAPILRNFYSANSSLDIDENNFPCDCRLDWIPTLLNRTESKTLQLAIDNLKCIPDDKVRELYAKATEAIKNQAVEDEANRNEDYEYYDDTQLNGKLFYIDLRELMNCTNATDASYKNFIYEKTQRDDKSNNKVNIILNNELFDSHIRKVPSPVVNNEAKPTEDSLNNKPEVYTTSRLATVSAKPVAEQAEKKSYDEGEMSADEAKPHALTDNSDMENMLPGNAQRNVACSSMAAIIMFRLLF